jgi:hypothetical protein
LITGEGYCISADSYYGRLSTAMKLLEHKHYFVLSCKADKPFSTELHPGLGKEKGSLRWASRKRELLALTWRDKKPINILTNLFPQPRWIKRRGRNEDEEGNMIPQVIAHYRATLGYVDRANSYRLRYPWRHRIFKHTRVQFMHLFFLAIVNSWILYCHVNKSKIRYRLFLLQLMEGLAAKGGTHRQHARSTKAPSPKAAPAMDVATPETGPSTPTPRPGMLLLVPYFLSINLTSFSLQVLSQRPQQPKRGRCQHILLQDHSSKFTFL